MKASAIAHFLGVDYEGTTEVAHLTLDARQTNATTAFVAIAGTQHHGAEFIHQVHPQTPLILVDTDVQGLKNVPNQPGLVWVAGLKGQLGTLAHWFYGEPSEAVKVIGITGTNGKTSVSHFIAQLLSQQGIATGLIGTLGYGIWQGDWFKTTNTTPDVLSVHAYLAKLRDLGAQAVAMEVSSHAIDQGRIAGVHFALRMITNMTQDHLDYHGTLEAYTQVKARFAQAEGLKLWNRDDGILATWPPMAHQQDYSIKHLQASYQPQGIVIEQAGQKVTLPLLGQFNLSNAWGAFQACQLLFGDLPFNALAHLSPVPGRCELVYHNPQVIIDYAHTPDGLRALLEAVRAHFPQQKLLVVFGAGGDRDQGKRPQMGVVAQNYADELIITNDNPRSEDPHQIAQMILAGMRPGGKVQVILDRRQAIETALTMAAQEAVVVIAGKGVEDYQIIGTQKIPFSDHQVVRDYFAQEVADAE